MRSHLKDVTLLVCDEHVRTCWGQVRHRRKSNPTPEAELSSLGPESNKVGSTADGSCLAGVEAAGGGWRHLLGACTHRTQS